MAEEEVEGQGQQGTEGEAPVEEKKKVQKIMCFVSKQMVPIDETVEVEYMPHKKVRVLPRYIRYSTGSAEEASQG